MDTTHPDHTLDDVARVARTDEYLDDKFRRAARIVKLKHPELDVDEEARYLRVMLAQRLRGVHEHAPHPLQQDRIEALDIMNLPRIMASASSTQEAH